MAVLLDASTLIALVLAEHEHHECASDWFAGAGTAAIDPIAQGALIRGLVRLGETPANARAVLSALLDDPRIEFWADDLSYVEAPLDGLHGHRQVTDAYVAALAASRGTVVATLDRAMAARYDAAFLVPS